MNLEDCRLGIFFPVVWKLYKAACKKAYEDMKKEKSAYIHELGSKMLPAL